MTKGGETGAQNKWEESTHKIKTRDIFVKISVTDWWRASRRRCLWVRAWPLVKMSSCTARCCTTLVSLASKSRCARKVPLTEPGLMLLADDKNEVCCPFPSQNHCKTVLYKSTTKLLLWGH